MQKFLRVLQIITNPVKEVRKALSHIKNLKELAESEFATPPERNPHLEAEYDIIKVEDCFMLDRWRLLMKEI